MTKIEAELAAENIRAEGFDVRAVIDPSHPGGWALLSAAIVGCGTLYSSQADWKNRGLNTRRLVRLGRAP